MTDFFKERQLPLTLCQEGLNLHLLDAALHYIQGENLPARDLRTAIMDSRRIFLYPLIKNVEIKQAQEDRKDVAI